MRCNRGLRYLPVKAAVPQRDGEEQRVAGLRGARRTVSQLSSGRIQLLRRVRCPADRHRIPAAVHRHICTNRSGSSALAHNQHRSNGEKPTVLRHCSRDKWRFSTAWYGTVRYGTARYGTVHFWGVFHWVLYLVPDTFLVPLRSRFHRAVPLPKRDV